MTAGTLYRMSAFTETPAGGNPAGVWIGDSLPDDETMQRIAAELGYSETAFVAPASGNVRTVRYFSPEAEVSFCGHATIATGAVLGTGEGRTRYWLETAVGEVPVVVSMADERTQIALTSVDTQYRAVGDALLDEFLGVIGWRREEQDDAIAPALAYAGAWHLVLAARDKSRLDALSYDFDTLKALMLREGLTTLQLVWRESEDVFHARNPFPVGGVVEDPATGAAAAAFGGYLRDAGIVAVPATFTIRQGEVMGRPSILTVSVPVKGGVTVSGTAVEIPRT